MIASTLFKLIGITLIVFVCISIISCDEVVREAVGLDLDVIWPNGGEQLKIGETYDIKWKSHLGGDVRIVAYKKVGSIEWNGYTVDNETEDNGIYTWTIPDMGEGQFKINIKNITNEVWDESDGTFTIGR